MSELSAEDAKLVTLARGARARAGSSQGAAVRDLDGRTYAGAAVELASLQLSAVQVCVAMAISSGSRGLEALAVLGASELDPADDAAVRELGGDSVVVHLA